MDAIGRPFDVPIRVRLRPERDDPARARSSSSMSSVSIATPALAPSAAPTTTNCMSTEASPATNNPGTVVRWRRSVRTTPRRAIAHPRLTASSQCGRCPSVKKRPRRGRMSPSWKTRRASRPRSPRGGRGASSSTSPGTRASRSRADGRDAIGTVRAQHDVPTHVVSRMERSTPAWPRRRPRAHGREAPTVQSGNDGRRARSNADAIDRRESVRDAGRDQELARAPARAVTAPDLEAFRRRRAATISNAGARAVPGDLAPRDLPLRRG